MLSKKKRTVKKVAGKQSTRAEAFVIMPIRDEGSEEHTHFLSLYEDYISPALIDAGFDVQRADKMTRPGLISKDVLSSLAGADLVVADLTDYRLDVIYELGIRHTLTSTGTVLILDSSRSTELPFALKDCRHIKYKGNEPSGLTKLKKDLTRAAERVSEQSENETDNSVSAILAELGVFSAKRNGTRNSHNEILEDSNGNILLDSFAADPEFILEQASQEIEDGLLPKELLNRAREAVSQISLDPGIDETREGLLDFLKVAKEFINIQTFTPSEREFSQLYYLSVRIDARKVSRAILDIGLKYHPDSRILMFSKVQNLARSTNIKDRESAKHIISEKFGLKIDSDSSNKLHAAIDQVDLLSIMLDVYHRDGKDKEALDIVSNLKKEFPEHSVALRNYARAIEKIGNVSTEEILKSYRDSVVCENADDLSATWYASTLSSSGKVVDALEVRLFACMLDLDEATTFSNLAVEMANIVQPQNLVKAKGIERKLTVQVEEGSLVTKAILLCMSCPNFGVEHKLSCERTMQNIDISEEQIQRAFDDEEGELSRKDRRSFIEPLYKELKSQITSNDLDFDKEKNTIAENKTDPD